MLTVTKELIRVKIEVVITAKTYLLRHSVFESCNCHRFSDKYLYNITTNYTIQYDQREHHGPTILFQIHIPWATATVAAVTCTPF